LNDRLYEVLRMIDSLGEIEHALLKTFDALFNETTLTTMVDEQRPDKQIKVMEDSPLPPPPIMMSWLLECADEQVRE